MRCRLLRGGRRINVLHLRCWPETLCIEWSGSVPQLHGPSEYAAVSVSVCVCASATVPGRGGWGGSLVYILVVHVHGCSTLLAHVSFTQCAYTRSLSYTGWIL